jgi:hypothetical protein
LISGYYGARELDELADYYPDVTVAASSPTFDILTLQVGLFHDLPYRARLFLEVPKFRPIVLSKYGSMQDLSGHHPGATSLIPPIRAWSFWDVGAEAGLPITSHHEYPDGSMCVCMSRDWLRGRDLIVDYVGFCVSWIAKALHSQLIGFYPGAQHLPPYIRRQRNRVEEYCGCGQPRRYGKCHRDSDLEYDAEQLRGHRRVDHRRYYVEVEAQERLRNPLRLVGRVVSPHAA